MLTSPAADGHVSGVVKREVGGVEVVEVVRLYISQCKNFYVRHFVKAFNYYVLSVKQTNFYNNYCFYHNV